MTSAYMCERIERVLAGNKEAFEQIYNETIHDVYRMLYVLTGAERDAEDIAQNVYLELYRGLGKYDRSRSFRGWLYGITIKQYQAYKRRKWKEYRKEQREREMHVSRPVTVEDATIERLDNHDVIVELHKLPEKLKQVLVLRYINELSQQEIAEGLGIPVGTVKSRLNRALLLMRQTTRREEHVRA